MARFPICATARRGDLFPRRCRRVASRHRMGRDYNSRRYGPTIRKAEPKASDVLHRIWKQKSSEVSPAMFLVAAAVVATSLALMAQGVGVLTVRSRLAAAKFARGAPEDEIIAETKVSQPLDLRVFLTVLKAVFFVRFSRATDETVTRYIEIHRHATENNVSVALLMMASYLAFNQCSAQGSNCSGEERVAAIALYVYLGMRLIHLVLYATATRQPYRALAFISSNVCLAILLRAGITALIKSA